MFAIVLEITLEKSYVLLNIALWVLFCGFCYFVHFYFRTRCVGNIALIDDNAITMH